MHQTLGCSPFSILIMGRHSDVPIDCIYELFYHYEANFCYALAE